MNQKIEIINFNEKVPLRLYSYNFSEIKPHWHQELEIVLILKDNCTLITNNRVINLKEDDIYLINENVIHEFKSENGCGLISLKIDLNKINDFDNNIKFSIDSTTTKNYEVFRKIKFYIAELVKINGSDNEENYLSNLSILYSILFELITKFKVDEKMIQSAKYVDKLNEILKYIEDHYKEGLSFAQIANEFHYSVPYLSSFFSHYLGVTFQNYYKDFRLERAVNELLHTDNSIEDIATNNGYQNPRGFVSAFKEKYGTLPSIYRKNTKITNYNFQDITSEEDLFNKSTMSLLSKYLTNNNENDFVQSQDVRAIKQISEENIDISKKGVSLKHTFRKFTSVARAKELMLSDVQKMLTELQNEVHYEYIKFHGLLSDDMLVYSEDELGNPIYSFVYIDKIFDFLLSIKLRPLVQFSFMPRALALHPERTAYFSPYILSMPKSMKKWTDLVRTLTLHLINRYGFDEVQQWLFCCWNEPDTSTNLFGFEKDKDYYELYKETYNTIKNIDKRLVFGSPSLLISYNINQQWCHRYIEWSKENNCIPDFMNIHYYDNDFGDESFEGHRPAKPLHSRLNRDENSFSKCIVKTKNLFKDWGIENLPIYLTEWNLTVSHRNLLNDTCFKSCYLTKNLLENYDKLDSFGYWVLTDMIEETLPSKEQFHGGLGLYTTAGIKKPHYYAFRFVNKLGDELIAKSNGYFITKSKNKIQIIAYNYEHFNHLFAQGETFDMNFLERYTPFNKLGPMELSLEFCSIEAKSCIIREQIVNQSYGSAFDEWIRMGAQPLNNDDIEYLKNISIPKRYVRTEIIDNNRLNYNASLDPLEIRLVEIEFKN